MSDFNLSIRTPPGEGWIQLPSGGVSSPGRLGKFFGRGVEGGLQAWAAEAAATLEPVGQDDALALRTRLLAKLARGTRQRGERMAWVWFPGRELTPAAQLSLSIQRPPLDEPVLTRADITNLLGWRDKQTISLEASDAALPIGQGVRIYRRQAGEHTALDDPEEIVVAVVYGVVPEDISDIIVVFSMYWLLGADSPALTEIADRLAATLKLVRS